MRSIALLLGVVLMAGGVLAAENPPASRNAPPKGPTIAVDPAACQWAVNHVPAPDVAYQPGVDVNGDPVAPADLDGGVRLQMPQRIEIPLTARLANVLPRTTGTVHPRADAYLGLITIDGDQVLFNGQPLTDPAETELAAVCRQQGR